MIPLRIFEIIEAIKGRVLTRVASNGWVKNISTDTRTLKKGDLFFALPGTNFDGHDFLEEAIKGGASGLVISRPSFKLGRSVLCPVIHVKDTVIALGDLAQYYRKKIQAKVIAIGGSNGKTTTKEMVYHILSRIYSSDKIHRSPRSFNNFIGVPLTMLSVEKKHIYAIFEVGTNRPGEIVYLGKIIQPDIAVVTNIAPVHLEGLKSMRGILREEVSLFKTVIPGGTIIYNSSNKWLKKLKLSSPKKYNKLTFGIGSKADFQLNHFEITSQGIEGVVNNRFRLKLSVLGSWNIYNALASLAVMKAIGVNLQQAIRVLRDFTLPPMRMEKESIDGVTFINDAYNANPESVRLLLEEIRQMKIYGRKILVLGDMRELGKYSRYFHRQIANRIYQASITTLLAVGEAVQDTVEELNRKYPRITTFYFKTASEAGEFLTNYLRPGDLVVLKGSRAIRLEEVLRRVKNSVCASV